MSQIGSSSADVSRGTSALLLSSDQVEQLTRFHDYLAGTAVERGLIGPREGEILWERHLLNCAVVAVAGTPASPQEAWQIPLDSSVADIGSGAGLPGVVWAIVRTDLRVVLIEPLLRRTVFLSEVVAELGLEDRVEVRRGRAEELAGDVLVDVTTARAVAPLQRLLPLMAPLTRPRGLALALKGAKASEELARVSSRLDRSGFRDGTVVEVGAEIINPPTRVVRLVRNSI